MKPRANVQQAAAPGAITRRGALGGLAALALPTLSSSPPLLLAALSARSARAQVWPNGPIKLVHGYAAGGSPDILARQIVPSLSERLGATIVVEARPGAGERLAAGQIARTPADGQTLYIMTGGLTVITATDSSIQFDLLKDYSYISLLTQYPFVFYVAAQSPYKTLADLLEAARQRPGKLTYSSTGVANTLHMSGELLCSMAGVTMNHVAYKGLNAFTDLIGGVIDMSVGTISTAQGLVREGRMRALCVTSPARWPGLESVPTVAETVPGYEVVTWAALTAPPGLPANIRDKVHAAVQETLKLKDVAASIESTGSVARGNTPEQMQALIAANIDKWKRVAQYAKIQLN